ncbi:hypothetical protein G7Y89_g11885 [Cudoniella acicularis]|uniref:Uncharacterized protein n=1 Tax=Cudoniella acicularis TaxID=354080 RepID=A0A8H4RB60_9HELO|nr:hypothetical protein G7Y89_g11885 [Cudoniella acicularis]
MPINRNNDQNKSIMSLVERYWYRYLPGPITLMTKRRRGEHIRDPPDPIPSIEYKIYGQDATGNRSVSTGEQCDNSLPLEYCLDDPFTMLTVSAMANFNNFFQNIAALVQKAKDNLNASTTPVDTQAIVGFALTVAGILLGIAAAIPGLEEFVPLGITAINAAVSIAGAAVSAYQQTSSDPSIENEFNLFANISASINALDNEVQVRL